MVLDLDDFKQIGVIADARDRGQGCWRRWVAILPASGIWWPAASVGKSFAAVARAGPTAGRAARRRSAGNRNAGAEGGPGDSQPGVGASARE